MDHWLTRVACVAFAGAVGAVVRWALSSGTQQVLGTRWPWGTLVVNTLGCLVFGIAIAWIKQHPDHSLWVRLVWLTGFAGAFTTFSTLAFDLHQLASDRGALWAALNLVLHLGLGLGALLAGMILARDW